MLCLSEGSGFQIFQIKMVPWWKMQNLIEIDLIFGFLKFFETNVLREEKIRINVTLAKN